MKSQTRKNVTRFHDDTQQHSAAHLHSNDHKESRNRLKMDLTDDVLSSKVFKRAQTNVHGKLKNYFLTHYSHSWVPGFNVDRSPHVDRWDLDNAMRLYQEFPYSCDLPKPLLPPVKISKNVLNRGDPALQLIATKMHINDDVDRILFHYQKNRKAFGTLPFKKNVAWENVNGVGQTELPRYIAELAGMIEMDPDPYFAGKYNWYYTGGSLTSVCVGGETLLIFPFAGDLVATSSTSRENSLWKPNLRKAASCEFGETIYELRTTRQADACRILARSRNQCVIYSIMERRDKLSMLQVHEQQSKVPYVSADLDETNCNKFCTMDVERTITLWDAVSCKSISKGVIDVTNVLEDKWGTVRYAKSDPNTIVFADRSCVHYLDIRMRFESPVLTLCPKKVLETCESLCLEVPSVSENHSYVGSYHSFLMCDRRSSPVDCVRQKWTHQFKSAPLLAAVHSRGEKEVIALSSQLAGETAIILNTWDGQDSPHSYSLPYNPPSALETLKESQMQGKCLDPSLRKRLELSNVGTSLVVDAKGDLTLFLQNSIGDIFYQCVTHEEVLDKYSLVNCQAYYAMEAWEKRILMQDRLVRPLVITERSNMHHVFDNFTNKDLILEHDKSPFVLFRQPKWKQPLEKLSQYVDILAPELLAVWDVSEDSVPVAQPAVPHQKVLHWLEMDSQKDSPLSQEQADFSCTPVNTQELFSVSQQRPEFIDIAEDVPQESYYLPVKVKTGGRKKPAKKRTYVAGF